MRMLTATEIAAMMGEVLMLHSEFARESKKAFRFDGFIPFGIHPITAGLLFIQEESLPVQKRVTGAKALFGHDLPEDTTAALPRWAQDPEVEKLIRGLTFSKNEDKYVDVWKRGEDVILLSFYDSVVNLMAVGEVKPERLAYKKQKVREHLEHIERMYPKLDIIKIAKGLLN